MNTFNKFYTGYALVLNPNGRGVPLSVNEMKNLKGKVTIFESWTNKFKNWISFNTYGSAYNDYYNRNVHDVNSYLLYTTSANAGQLQLAANPQTLMLLYLERALIEPHSDLGDMINPPAFIKLYGFNYKHLDSNSKFWMEAASGIDPNGNMSYFNYLLNLLIILPGEFLGSSLLRVLSKAGTLGKILSGLGISIVERVLGKRAVQMLSLAYKNGSATLRRYLIDPILKKFPKFKIPSIKEVWQGAVKIAKLITLDPVEWYKTLKNTPIGKLVFGNKQQNLQALLRKMGLRGKVKPSELPYYINLIKSVTEGPLGIVKFGLGIFTKATQNALTRWLNSSNFKKKYFQTVTTITNSPLYKGVHEKTKTWIKGLLEITGVYGASRTLYNEYQQMKKYGLTGYVKYKFNNLKKSFTDNKYVKGLYKEYKKYKEYGLTGYVKYKIKHNRYTAGLYKEYKKYKKYGLTGYVKYKFNNFKKAVANNKYVKAAVKYTKAAANYVNNTWNGATRWAGGFLGEFFHRR